MFRKKNFTHKNVLLKIKENIYTPTLLFKLSSENLNILSISCPKLNYCFAILSLS